MTKAPRCFDHAVVSFGSRVGEKHLAGNLSEVVYYAQWLIPAAAEFGRGLSNASAWRTAWQWPWSMLGDSDQCCMLRYPHKNRGSNDLHYPTDERLHLLLQ